MFTVLSYGAGQDSKAILVKLATEPLLRKTYVQGPLVTLMSNTRNEHDATYADLPEVKEICQSAGFHWVFLDAEMGFHSASWPGLKEFYRSNNTIGSKAYPKSCTDQLKIRPIYRFLEALIGENYGFKVGRKEGFYRYAEKFGKLHVMIGIAADEDRVSDGGPLWMQRCIEKVYPLRDWGMIRKDCQDYLRLKRYNVPPPSNCKMCPYMSHQELLWMYRFDRNEYDELVVLEANKIKANLHVGEKNFGVFGRRLLPEVLSEAQTKYGHWTDEELRDYKMSHGHCVRSKY